MFFYIVRAYIPTQRHAHITHTHSAFLFIAIYLVYLPGLYTHLAVRYWVSVSTSPPAALVFLSPDDFLCTCELLSNFQMNPSEMEKLLSEVHLFTHVFHRQLKRISRYKSVGSRMSVEITSIPGFVIFGLYHVKVFLFTSMNLILSSYNLKY